MRLAAISLVGIITVPNTASADPIVQLPPTIAWSGDSERLIAKAGDPWITPAERSGFATSPHYAEVTEWLGRLKNASSLVSVHSFGKTAEGRDLFYVRASKGGGPKPVVLMQAGIHSGEIDGKDAGLMLLRDIALRGKDRLLDKVDLVFVPVLNIDGHERMSAWGRLHQRDPNEKGLRANARNVNLNRDYAKLDAPETQAIVRLLRELDPALYVDLHVSDGFDQQYDVTYTYAGWGKYARHRQTANWLEQRFGPAVDRTLTKAGHHPAIYPSPIDTHDPTKGIRYSPEGPRYSTGYGDFIGVPTVLVENHSLKPYRQRVLGTYVLLETALRVVGEDADRIAAAKLADRASRPTELMTRWKPSETPIGWVKNFKGVAFETYLSPASGRQEQRWLGKPVDLRIPIIGQEPTESVRIPKAWLVPVEQTEVIDRLERHGIQFESLSRPQALTVDRARLISPKLLQPSEGRVPVEATFEHQQRQEIIPAGTIRVPADQPLGLLAAALLEPESQDSFLASGFFPEAMAKPLRSEDFMMAPMADALLAANPDLKAAFEAKLASDPAFTADPDARLAWLFDRSPYRDPFMLAYPVMRELN